MQKNRVILDTNVLVSAALGNGYCTKILVVFERGSTFQIFYSNEVLVEYKRVSAYSRIIAKYPLFEAKMSRLISMFERFGTRVTVNEIFTLLKDSSDNKFLDLAYACKADYLVTGNHLDFIITKFYQTKIVSPKQFWEQYETSSL